MKGVVNHREQRWAWLAAGLLMLSAAGATLAESTAPAAPFLQGHQPTSCPGEEKIWNVDRDLDVSIPDSPDLFVMFHGNRFPTARAMVNEFERQHPGVRIAYSAVPPVDTHLKLKGLPPRIGKLKDAPYPDVVMLPAGVIDMLGQWLGEATLYSQIAGVMLVARSDDTRVTDAKALIERKDLKVVLPGIQSTNHGIYVGMRQYYGDEAMTTLKASGRVGYSQLMHHRSIPARILAGCEDVGVQFVQSQRFLEERFPGRFKFFPMPASNPNIFADEDSLIAIPKQAPHPELARTFVNFMMSESAQAILARYGVARRPALQAER